MIDEDAKTKNIMVAEEVTKDNKKLKKKSVKATEEANRLFTSLEKLPSSQKGF